MIRGETYHFEIVSNESARGIMDLTVGRRLCIGNGILTTEDDDAGLGPGPDPARATRAAARRARRSTMIALKRSCSARPR